MTPIRPFGWADALALVVVLLVAGGMRGGYLWYYADAGRTDGICRVQDGSASFPSNTGSHDAGSTDLEALVRNLETRQWYGDRAPFATDEELTAHYSPGYPFLLGWLGRAVGTGDPARFGALVRWLQCGLGTITAVLYFLFARRAFRSLVVGALAGLAVAADPFAVFSTAEIQDGVLTSFLVAVVLLLGARANQLAVPLGSLFYGLALAGLSLVRAACLPFAFVALIWYLLRCRTLTRGWLCAVLAFLGFINGMAPWMVRNLQTFGEPLPVVDSTWLHLMIGNNPEGAGCLVSESGLWKPQRPYLQAIPGPQQPRRYDRLAPLLRDFVCWNPAAALHRRLAAAGYFLLGAIFFDNYSLAEVRWGFDEKLIETTLHAVLLGAIPLAFVGWRWSYAWRRESMPAALAVLWLPLPYILGHAEWLHGPRLPLDGLLLTFAAFGLLCLIPGFGKGLREGPATSANVGPGDIGAPVLPPLPHTSPVRSGQGRGPSWR